jgi:putative ABC transport system permease protein
LIGKNWRAPFGVLISLNSNFGPNFPVGFLAVLSIALAVALATGLEMSSRAVQAEMERTADALAGSARIELAGGTLGIPERLLGEAEAVPGVRAASPLLEATFHLKSDGLPIHILGVDMASDVQVRPYTVWQEGLRIRDPLRILVRPESVIVTEALARRIETKLGGSFRVRSHRGEVDLRIEGVLAEEGLASAFRGQIALMDVYSLQTLMGQEGWFHRIDIVPDPGMELEALLERLRVRVAGAATVRQSVIRESFLGRTVATLRLAVVVISAVGTAVACLLAYSAISVSVDRRMGEFALLRSTGLEAYRVRRLIMLDALAYAAIGTALGLGLGVVLSPGFLSTVSGVSEVLQGVELDPSALEIRPATVSLAVCVGIVVALFGMIAPARRASRRWATDVLSERRSTVPSEVPGRTRAPLTLGLLALLAGIWMADALPQAARLGLLLTLGMLLSIVAAPMLFGLVLRARPLLERVLPHVGHLCGTGPAARPWSTALTVGAVAGIFAMVSGTMIIVESLGTSLGHWAATRFASGIMVTAGEPFTGVNREHLSPETVELIRGTPGIGAVDEQYNLGSTTLFRGEEVYIGGLSMDVLGEYGGLPTIGSSGADVARALVRGEIAISDAFAHRFDINPDETITLTTPRGSRDFRVAGIVRDYAGPAGSLLLDLETFDRLWPRDGASALVIWTEGPGESVLEEIRRRVGERQSLFFTHGETLRRAVERSIREFTALLYVMAGLALVLGLIAVTNMLIGLVVEQRRDLALLRAAGATPRDLVALVIADGMLVSVGGALLGMGLGFALSDPMAQILEQALGWTIELVVSPLDLAPLLALTCGAVLVAAAYPAWTARRTLPTEVFAPE